MNKSLKPNDLAKALNINNAVIYVNIKRGKIHLDSEKKINIKHPINDAFLQLLASQGKTFDINRVFEKKIKPEPAVKIPTPVKIEIKNESVQPDPDEKLTWIQEKQNEELKKLKLHNEIELLKKQKIEGQLVPVDAIQDLFIWAIDTFHKCYAQEVDSLGNVYVQILGADHASFTKITKQLNQTLNKLKQDAKENILAGIDGVVDEYQDVRGRGEKK